MTNNTDAGPFYYLDSGTSTEYKVCTAGAEKRSTAGRRTRREGREKLVLQTENLIRPHRSRGPSQRWAGQVYSLRYPSMFAFMVMVEPCIPELLTNLTLT